MFQFISKFQRVMRIQLFLIQNAILKMVKQDIEGRRPIGDPLTQNACHFQGEFRRPTQDLTIVPNCL